MDDKIYRKVSIERLSSPEQLDRIITITSMRAWLILIALGCIIAAVVVWSVTGSLSTDIAVKGILVKSGGITDISSSGEGRISDIRVRPGDLIKKGDIVARLDQNELVEKITELSEKINYLKQNNGAQKDIYEADRQTRDLKKRLRSETVVISQEDGRVVNVNSKSGDVVTPGTVLMSIVKEEKEDENLIAVMYVPIEHGKSLAPGMEAHVSPSTVRKEKYGYILGRIASVSEYPVTVQTARQSLGSIELAQEYTGGTACLEVVIDLTADKNTESGYKWSTLSGVPYKIENDTVCSASVIVERQHPIAMVLPQLEKLLEG